MKRLMMIGAALLVAGCSDAPGARKTLAQQGYSDVKIKGWALFGCAESDSYNTEFQATSPGGSTVTGNVCKGFLKGATVRLH